MDELEANRVEAPLYGLAGEANEPGTEALCFGLVVKVYTCACHGGGVNEGVNVPALKSKSR
jgi:hypothetical protein